jgi:hypothetical protein
LACREHWRLARAQPGNDGREQEPDEFEHVLSIADLLPASGLPPHRLASAFVTILALTSVGLLSTAGVIGKILINGQA